MSAPELTVSERLIRARRSALWRMLVLPVVLAVAVFFLALIVRDLLIQKDYNRRFENLAAQVLIHSGQNVKMPNGAQFGQLLVQAGIHPNVVTYEGDVIGPNVSADTLICHAQGVPFFILEDGNVLVFRDGRVLWVDKDEYDLVVTRHRQRLTAEALQRPQR